MVKIIKDIFMEVYDIEEEKIEIVYYGVFYMEFEDREILKEKYGLKGRKVIFMFGFISSGKGLEYVIEVMDKVRKEFLEVVYLILG